MRTNVLTVPLGERSYDIYFGDELAPLFQEWICRFFPGGAVFVVTDRTVGGLYGDEIARWLTGIPYSVLELPPGEEAKSWDTAREIYGFLANGGADRESLIVAFGGGVVGDLAGFAAATFLRGLSCVQIPTTLLSQVDSSVGGKTGFNLSEGKNLVGAFHQPRGVFIDSRFLHTLDERNMRSGMAEVVKCAAAGNAALWAALSVRGADWREMSSESWHEIVTQTVAFKAAIVAKDERESSIRRILNLGHTVGHALERGGGYARLLHGEAVAMGLAWEAAFARRRGFASAEVEREIVEVLSSMGFALDDPGIPLSAIAAAIGLDKKRVSSDIDMPVVTSPGKCALKRVPVAMLRRELPAIRAELRERARRPEAMPDAVAEARGRMERGEVEDVAASLSRRLSANPHDAEALILLAEAHHRLGKVATAWEAIKSALALLPGDERAQRLAAEIEREVRRQAPSAPAAEALPVESVVVFEGGVFPLTPADGAAVPAEPATPPRETAAAGGPAAPERREEAATGGSVPAPEGRDAAPPEAAGATPVRTITMADVYWVQGDRETARRIVREILAAEPGNGRALAWLAARDREDSGAGGGAERALIEFLETMAKEYGYDLSRPH